MDMLERLRTFLEQYGWQYEQPGEGLIVTGFRGRTGVFRLFVQVTEGWVIVAIAPFVPQPEPECAGRLHRALLRLNYEMNLVKVGLDADEDVVLMAELPAEDLRYEDMARALDAITFSADSLYLPLANLATDPNYIFPDDIAALWVSPEAGVETTG